MSEEDPPAKRMRLGGDGLVELSREELLAENKKLEAYVATLLSKLDGSTCTSGAQSDLEERLKQQHAEANRKEKVLLMQLTRKEQELQEMATQLGDLTKGNTPGPSQLRSSLLDPALNILLQRMRRQLDDKSKKLQQATDDMAAWKFTPDSQTGKRLMSKCRTLILENQELGKQVSTGRTAQLEAELALQKKYSEELKASQDELNEFVIQLDEEVEGMQSTICALQQQLKDAKDELSSLKTRQSEPGLPRLGQTGPVDQRTTPTATAPESPTPESFKSPSLGPSPSPAPATPCSPAGSPPSAELAGRRTPHSETNFTADPGEIEEAQDHRAWSSEVSPPTPPSAEAAIPAEGDWTADRTPLSPREEDGGGGGGEEEKERTSEEDEQPRQPVRQRTPEPVPEQVRTFSDEEMETQEPPWQQQQQQPQQPWQQEQQQQERQQQQQREEAEEMDYQLTGQDPRDPSSPSENAEHQEESQGWCREEPASPDGQQHQQQQLTGNLADRPSFEMNSSSPDSQGHSATEDFQGSHQTGELTSPSASPDVSKAEGDTGHCLEAPASPDAGTAEPPAPEQPQVNALVPDQTPPEAESSVEPSSRPNQAGVLIVDQTVGSQAGEGPAPEEGEADESPSTNSQPPVQSHSEGDGDDRPSGDRLTLSDGLGSTNPFPEVKVTAKKLPHNCSLSVVDYDTGSSEEEEGMSGGSGGGAGNGGPQAHPSIPPATNHSPASPLPDPSSPDNDSPTSPTTNSDSLEVPPLKSQTPAGAYGDNGAGETKDMAFIGENGTESVHASDPLATVSE